MVAAFFVFFWGLSFEIEMIDFKERAQIYLKPFLSQIKIRLAI
jgi:hypothetical protein